MTSKHKLILGIGNFQALESIYDYFKTKEDRFILSNEGVRNVTLAMNKLNSNLYWGVLMSSLELGVGKEFERYNPLLEELKEFKNPPDSDSSGGLYIVKQSCKKGLITVVNAITEKNRALKKAEELGAKCFRFNDPYNTPEENLKYFQNFL